MIRIVDVSKEYKAGLWGGRVRAVTGLDLHVREGEIFGFLGPNGAGKSTTIKILMNFIRPTKGSATICGVPVGEAEARAQVGFLPENPCFYSDLTAEELLFFGGRTSGMATALIRQRCAELLGQMELRGVNRRRVKTFSKGMLQRLGLAYSLMHDPRVVILDEPMSGLDPLGRKLVGDLMLALKAEGKTVFFSSHILNDVEKFCDRAGIIVGGVLQRLDTVSALLADASSLEEVFLREVAKASPGGGV